MTHFDLSTNAFNTLANPAVCISSPLPFRELTMNRQELSTPNSDKLLVMFLETFNTKSSQAPMLGGLPCW